MAGCCGCWESFCLWERLVKAYKYMTELLSLTHSFKEPADGISQGSKMDIGRLEEQYHCMKQKQKQEMHIIVFKSENDLISGETIVNTVPVNEIVRKEKAFEDRMPIKDVMLEVPDKNYLKDSDGTWHAHLNIHRHVQLDCQIGIHYGTEKEKEINFENKRQPLSRMTSYEMLSTSEKGPNIHNAPTRSSSLESNPRGSAYRNCSLQQSISASWASLKPPSPTQKLVYYPFPQKKNPRMSEAARRLGLYVTH
ncbi:hypothetical protein GDO86_012098 [Hymenochirus boettgeri]|uniref:TBC1 domain-containing protein n=1 Tax=Hymenochirus boettgeri TaxID=247094 RepID=A0A8T2JIR4_9PIPI|nr:hypothetical protein GDO86_012098 [Hymenochirus boettgeri]